MSLDDSEYARLARFLSGEMSPEEAAGCEVWIAEDSERQAVAEEMRRVWKRDRAPGAEDWDADAALRRIKSSRRADASPHIVHFPVPRAYGDQLRRSRRAVVLTRIAAALLLLAAGIGVRRRHATTPSPAPVPAPVAMSEVVTRRGERATIQLADGSRITMAPGTRVRYAQTFGQHERDIYLEGQALFAVVHDTTRPFRVRTARGVATDIGTRFVVRAYHEERRLDVAVADGAVSLEGTRDGVVRDAGAAEVGDGLLLGAGDVGRVGTDGTPRARRNVDVKRYLAWTDGELVFLDTPLPEVLAEIGRWYDVDARIVDTALAHAHVTATYRDESLSGALQSIAVATGAHYERTGRTVRFTLRRTSP